MAKLQTAREILDREYAAAKLAAQTMGNCRAYAGYVERYQLALRAYRRIQPTGDCYPALPA